MPPVAPRPPSKPAASKGKAKDTTSSRTNTQTGITTTVTTKNGIPTHVSQWDSATGKRTADRDLPMQMKH